MRNDITSEMLARYFGGTSSEDERRLMENKIADDAELAKTVRALRRTWEAASHGSASWNVDSAWKKVSARISEEADREADSRVRVPQTRAKQLRRWERAASLRESDRPVDIDARKHRETRRRLAPIALLVFLVAGAVGYVAFRSDLLTPPGAYPPGDVYATDRGERATLHLPDGTEVRLNVDTRLTVDRAFGDADREVRLQGEAYFAVAHDPARPFIIQTEKSVVEVVGTEFAVSSYPEESSHVVVADGVVRVENRGEHIEKDRDERTENRGERIEEDRGERIENRDERIEEARGERTERGEILRAGDLMLEDAGKWTVRRNAESLTPYLSWLDDQLYFDKTPFDQVCRQLERWYDLDISSTVPVSEVGWLSATLSEEPIDEVLQIVSTALELSYDQEGNDVIFSRNAPEDE